MTEPLSNPGEIDRYAEDELWSGLQFTVLTEQELAERQKLVDEKVHFEGGVWWRELRPYFCQPNLPYRLVNREESQPRLLRALAGYMHLCSDPTQANGLYRAIVRRNVDEYSIGHLPASRRRSVRKGLAPLRIRPVERLSEMLEGGYNVYRSWHERVAWGRDKTSPVRFGNWMTAVFRQGGVVLGAYRDDKLVAFMMPFAVGQIASPAFVASCSEHLGDHPNEALYHAFLCICRQTPGITMAEFGPVSSKPSLDQFKLHFAEIECFPSYAWLNPLLKLAYAERLRQRFPWLDFDGRLLAQKQAESNA